MIRWQQIQNVIKEFKKSKNDSDYVNDTGERNVIKYNLLDYLANLLQGTSPCVALALKKSDSTIVLAANCKPDIPFTVTDYETGCMLEYIVHLANRDIQQLQNILREDKRFAKLVNYNSVKTKIQKLCNKLRAENAQRIDNEFDMEFNANEPNQSDIILDQLDNLIERFDQELAQENRSKSKGFSPQSIIELFEAFLQEINICLDQLKEYKSKSVDPITKYLNKNLKNDIKFVYTLQKILDSFETEKYILQVLKSDIEYSLELGDNDLPELQIDRTDVPERFKNNLSFHAEHRLAVNPEEYVDNYIGISKLCCPICYYIVHNHLEYEVAGNHDNYYFGSALIGLRLHEKAEQIDILRNLFPPLQQELDELPLLAGQEHIPEPMEIE